MRNLLIFRDAENAKNGKIAANWNVSGTWTFQPVRQFRGKIPLSRSDFRQLLPSFPEARLSVLIRVWLYLHKRCKWLSPISQLVAGQAYPNAGKWNLISNTR
jgi:hypothetical protein